MDETIEFLNKINFLDRFFDREANLWKSEPDHLKVINNRLGWIELPNQFIGKIDEIVTFAQEIKNADIEDVVLCGMGGSSLCAEVAQKTFGSANGYPNLHVLDNTSPAAVKDLEEIIDLKKTIFIVASKSGGTVETMSFYHYFYQAIKELGVTSPGAHFIAITDPDTKLQNEAEQKSFRKIFSNPADIGGRYSVLSYFGLVPMALIGIDIRKILSSATSAYNSAKSEDKYESDAAQLGAFMGQMVKEGRDKMTIMIDPSIESFASWAEQLVAESTGKEGQGVIPIVGETPKSPLAYEQDRAFVFIRKNDVDAENDQRIKELKLEGHPVFEMMFNDAHDLGGLFWKWELATAIAGKILDVNPFDEPNVAEAKSRSNDMLDKWRNGTSMLDQRPETKDIATLLEQIQPNSYFSILSYIPKNDELHQQLSTLREKIGRKYEVATTLDYGPRYLHSTGQLHKGGAKKGIFIVITEQGADGVKVPTTDYDFNTLHLAKGFGDIQSLVEKGLPVASLHIDEDGKTQIEELKKKIDG